MTDHYLLTESKKLILNLSRLKGKNMPKKEAVAKQVKSLFIKYRPNRATHFSALVGRGIEVIENDIAEQVTDLLLDHLNYVIKFNVKLLGGLYGYARLFAVLNFCINSDRRY